MLGWRVHRFTIGGRIHASRSILGVPVGAHVLFGEFQEACLSLGETDVTTRRRELRHGSGGYALYSGLVIVWVERLE